VIFPDEPANQCDFLTRTRSRHSGSCRGIRR